MAQLLSSMELTLDIKFPPVYADIMGHADRIANVGFSTALPFRCDFKYGTEEKLWCATVSSMGVVALEEQCGFGRDDGCLGSRRSGPSFASASSGWPTCSSRSPSPARSGRTTRRSRSSERPNNNHFSVHESQPTRFSLALLYVVFPSASTQIFYSFVCTTFDYDADSKFRSVMIMDYSVSCNSTKYARIRLYASFFAFLYPAVPLLFFVVLFRVRTHLNPMLYATPEARVEGLTKFVEREIAVSEGLPSRELLSKLEDALLHKQQQLRDEFPDIEPYQLLYREFEPEYWYWDTVDGIRRLVLSAAIAVFARGDSIQAVVGCTLSFCYAALVASQGPYVDPEDDWLARCSTQIIVLVYIVAVGRYADMSEETGKTRESYRRLLLLFGVIAPLLLILKIIAHMIAHDSHFELNAMLERDRAGEFSSFGDDLDLWELVGSSWVESHIPQAPRRSVIVRYMDRLGLPTTLAPPTVVVIDEPSKAVLPAESRLQQRIHCESPIEESDVALIAGGDAPVVDDGFASCGATCGVFDFEGFQDPPSDPPAEREIEHVGT